MTGDIFYVSMEDRHDPPHLRAGSDSAERTRDVVGHGRRGYRRVAVDRGDRQRRGGQLHRLPVDDPRLHPRTDESDRDDCEPDLRRHAPRGRDVLVQGPRRTMPSATPARAATRSRWSSARRIVGARPPRDVVVAVDGGATAVTAPFSTSTAGELLVAFVGSDGPRSVAVDRDRQRCRTHVDARAPHEHAGRIGGSAASVRHGALTNVTVQSALTNTATPDQSLTVVAFKGASGAGASAGAAGATGAPTVGLTTTSGGSLVYAVGNDWDRAQARTLGTGQSMVHQWVNTTTGDTYWVQQLTGPVVAGGANVTVNDTARPPTAGTSPRSRSRRGHRRALRGPGTLSASGGVGSVSLSWGAATDAVGVTGYSVYRSTVSGFTPGPTNQIGIASGSTFGDSGSGGRHLLLPGDR